MNPNPAKRNAIASKATGVSSAPMSPPYGAYMLVVPTAPYISEMPKSINAEKNALGMKYFIAASIDILSLLKATSA